MKIALTVNWLLLTLLSITSGIAKIMRMPQELEFFSGAGFSEASLVSYGAVQLAGGVMLLVPKLRIWGAITMAIAFAVSTVVIFMAGEVGFGFFSILPVLMAGFVIVDSLRQESKV